MITRYVCQALCKPEAKDIELVSLILPAPGNLLIHSSPLVYD